MWSDLLQIKESLEREGFVCTIGQRWTERCLQIQGEGLYYIFAAHATPFMDTDELNRTVQQEISTILDVINTFWQPHHERLDIHIEGAYNRRDAGRFKAKEST